MATLENRAVSQPNAKRPAHVDKALAALDRGELFCLLADVDGGTLTPDELAAAIDRRAKRRTIQRFFAALFGL